MADLVIETVDLIFDALRKNTRDVNALSKEMQTVLRVHSAQGVIDNGGLQYFFESNWEGRPPYKMFIDAYREIGASAAADRLEEAVALFNFPDPHLDADKRCTRMEELWDDPDRRFGKLDLKSCGDKSVWRDLEKYIKRHASAFKAQPRKSAKRKRNG